MSFPATDCGGVSPVPAPLDGCHSPDAGDDGPGAADGIEAPRPGHPIVLITAQADETLFPRLIAQGAVECVLKPFSDTTLFDAVSAALAFEIAHRATRAAAPG